MVRDFPVTRRFQCQHCGLVIEHHQMKCERCQSLIGYVPATDN